MILSSLDVSMTSTWDPSSCFDSLSFAVACCGMVRSWFFFVATSLLGDTDYDDVDVTHDISPPLLFTYDC